MAIELFFEVYINITFGAVFSDIWNCQVKICIFWTLMRYGINQSESVVTVVWICFVAPQQGGLHEKEVR